MIEIQLLEIAGFASALKALHLPFGKKCDSYVEAQNYDCFDVLSPDIERLGGDWRVFVSNHDKDLLMRLVKAGDEHAKVVRGIVAWLDINAPRYWWAEFDTYRIGREQLASESTMHIQGKGLNEEELVRMKSELHEGTMQRRVQMISYQTLRRMWLQRRTHRLPEWRMFCKWVEKLPFSWLITNIDNKKQKDEWHKHE